MFCCWGEDAKATGLTKDSTETLVIFGGCGRQGLSVAKEACSLYPKCNVKLVSRGAPNSDRAKAAFEKCGGSNQVSVVTADCNEKDTLKPVLEGAYGVFLVTAFWPAEADGGN
ncbi:unnamed protein product [Polarella glacialis]|uniref:NmrA-like domain-containing protein n=1 Tax=Polarella glacialis TaxID=89957 RepID=A0A813GHN4_POLGL|nr:unnamed protein product [Polarella glacialis]CAE8647436.1 unnamed protein product [Polarella glacialis]CAE8708246.1 unnamed protein product [Polarella glacialis]